MAKRLLFETDKRLLWKLAWNMGFKGARAIHMHKKRLARGEFFPPFLYISIINSCNLRCQGCWVDVAAKQVKIDVAAMDRIINESNAQGNYFFGIFGGEPFMHGELLEILQRHPDCYFQVFTNGHFITDEIAKTLHRLGNVSPLISIEGTEIISDQRRGGKPGVYHKSIQGIQTCIKHKLLTGVCTSLCQTNIDDLLTEQWIDRLIDMGAMYCWYHVYRPIGPNPNPDLALSPEQQRRARRFVVEMRVKKPIAMIDAYYDADGKALCPAATGFTHHIGPAGDIEPCPIIQLAKESIYDDQSLRETFNHSEFLRDFRELAASATRGCIVLERPDLLVELAEKHNARDTTVRGTSVAELKALKPQTSQYNPGNEIPEKSWFYRFVKKLCFHDFGVYEKHFNTENWQDPKAATRKTKASVRELPSEPLAEKPFAEKTDEKDAATSLPIL